MKNQLICFFLISVFSIFGCGSENSESNTTSSSIFKSKEEIRKEKIEEKLTGVENQMMFISSYLPMICIEEALMMQGAFSSTGNTEGLKRLLNYALNEYLPAFEQVAFNLKSYDPETNQLKKETEEMITENREAIFKLKTGLDKLNMDEDEGIISSLWSAGSAYFEVRDAKKNVIAARDKRIELGKKIYQYGTRLRSDFDNIIAELQSEFDNSQQFHSTFNQIAINKLKAKNSFIALYLSKENCDLRNEIKALEEGKDIRLALGEFLNEIQNNRSGLMNFAVE